MYKYSIYFAQYRLRDYERYLAVKEFENQFPIIKDFTVKTKCIELKTPNLINEEKIKKLTFFCKYQILDGETKTEQLTYQTIAENYTDDPQKLLQSLENNKSRNIRYLTHSFHEYKGRFYPQLAKSLMNYAGIDKGKTILDPFCGSGTTLVESLLFGVNAIGIDINPIAHLLAKAKVRCLLLKPRDFEVLRHSFVPRLKNADWENNTIDNYKDSLEFEYLKRWFPLNNLKQIIKIQTIIKTLENVDEQLFAKVTLSNLLRDYSYQDPSQLRIRIRKDNPPENLIEKYIENFLKQINDLEKYNSLNKLELTSNIQTYLGDVRTLDKTIGIKPHTIDLVITSPPYATALPYIDTDRLSLYVFGFVNKNNFRELEESLIGNREITKTKREQLDKELESNFQDSILPKEIIDLLKYIYFLNKNSDVGFRRKNTAALLYKYFYDMNTSLYQISKSLKKKSMAFFVVGDNKTRASDENITIPTADFISLIAKNNKFELVEKIDLSVQKSYSIHSKNSINTESVLVFQRR